MTVCVRPQGCLPDLQTSTTELDLAEAVYFAINPGGS